jgi:hypothetical protein
VTEVEEDDDLSVVSAALGWAFDPALSALLALAEWLRCEAAFDPTEIDTKARSSARNDEQLMNRHG